jgi:hypothetical protein
VAGLSRTSQPSVQRTARRDHAPSFFCFVAFADFFYAGPRAWHSACGFIAVEFRRPGRRSNFSQSGGMLCTTTRDGNRIGIAPISVRACADGAFVSPFSPLSSLPPTPPLLPPSPDTVSYSPPAPTRRATFCGVAGIHRWYLDGCVCGGMIVGFLSLKPAHRACDLSPFSTWFSTSSKESG